MRGKSRLACGLGPQYFTAAVPLRRPRSFTISAAFASIMPTSLAMAMNFVKGDDTPDEAPPVQNYSMVNVFPQGMTQLELRSNLGDVLPVMEKQGGGAIVNLASTSGLRWTGAAQVGYAATKAAVIQLSKVVAVQYASKGIRVNTVIPGQLHTPMVEARLAKQRAGGDVEKLLKSRVERIPLGFMGDGRDTANAALYLASDEARFVTGTEIVVDGGMVARCD